MPPLKKKVTCAYFSVSAIRNCRSPLSATISPKVAGKSNGGNATGRSNFSLYWVIVTNAARAGARERGKFVNVGSDRASVICLARSARKFANTITSPSSTRTILPLTSWMVLGWTNSSVSPRPYAASSAAIPES